MTIADRYQPIGSVGSGGMGDVIQCTDTHLDRAVVVKTLQSGVDHSRLLDEQKALLKLRSRHVVQLYDIVEVSARGAKGLVLEYIAGQDLQVSAYQVGPEYLQVLWQIACGIRDIHRANVIHRDLKPGNIRIDGEGVVKIFDFGLARSIGVDDRTRSIIGTPIFMAPELWGQSTISFSTAIDVYAFGVIAISLLQSSVPLALASHPPLPVPKSVLDGIFMGLAGELITCLSACLASDPTARPSMELVTETLERHVLNGRHHAIAVINSDAKRLDTVNRSISMSVPGGDSLGIHYDGLQFLVATTAGNVFVNNSAAKAGRVIPGCCVLTFGVGSGRTFVTFDISNPEVMA